jgi:hypothetical protein
LIRSVHLYTFYVILILSICCWLIPFSAIAGIDEPHNVINSIGCGSCHDVTAFDQPKLMPAWTAHEPVDIDDTQFNTLCVSCHVTRNVFPNIMTHSSLQTGNKYGDWTVGCWVCHNQHSQDQDNLNGSSYGKLIRAQVRLDDIQTYVDNVIEPDPSKTGSKTVIFKGPTGENSFADGNEVYDGICEICHTKTTHFRNNGSGNDQLHANVGAVAGTACTYCHSHENGFAHGGGGAGCIECHGHDAGTLYDPDMMANSVTPGVEASQGKGSFQSHSTHTETDADDLKGPGIYCADCHDINNFPSFKSGTDVNGDGRYNLAETDVCNSCHSQGGTYDGIDDPVIGAKTIWRTGAYVATNDSTLSADKEKWCATCHDEMASVISSVTAPNVIGDEDGSYTYGTGWGYYKTGHGLGAGEQFPSKGGVETLSGRPVKCDSCHDYATAHIDGAARTYDDGDFFGLDPAVYRQGYRLKLIDGQEPYSMPRPSNIGTSADQFRVCFQIGCHDSGPFTDDANMNTNLVTDGINRHTYHLLFNNQEMAAADWSGAYNSRMTCVVCHNVHGSTRLAMVRDGKLIDREPGQQIWYKNDAVTYIDVNTSNPPEPDDLPLSASDGTAWIGASASNLCANCHSGWSFTWTEDRTPFQDVAKAPFLEWVGTNDLVSDGVAPDSGVGNSTFTFRVSYSDINNDSPSPIEVWVDLNDNGGYEVGEKFVMAGTETLDTNLVNGKTYTKSLAIARAGDGVLNYRFYAFDGGLEASGAPTANSTLTILNNAPTLAWTGEDFFQTDGINPDTGGNGDIFAFSINYIDIDNEAPSIIQVWIDENDVDSYEAAEEYALTEVDSGDTTYSDGKLYTLDLPLAHAGDGNLNYRYYAADANDDAMGEPTQDRVLTVQVGTNSPPSLEFVAADCTVDGVQPQTGATGADFVLTVRYTDNENEGPSTIQVWIDENDVDSYEASEKYDLTEVDSGDTTYSDGKLYTITRALTLAGDNVLNYRFYATDGIDTAVGEAAGDHSVTVVDALKVRPAGGSGWYTTIQSAIDAVNGAHTVLVDEGTYNEDILFQYGSNDSNTSLRSVCGPDTTIINGSGIGTTVIFSRYSSSQIDGFQVTGGTTGIEVQGTQVTINNCQVHDNNGLNGGGIYVRQSGDMPELTLTNSEIYNNSSDRGGGVSIWRGTGHLISNSIIRNNTITGDSLADGGGGIHLFQIGDEITISNSIIKDNASTNTYGGGGLYVSQVPDTAGAGLTVSDSVISGNTTGGHGGGILSDLSKIKFVRSSITDNTAGEMGGALAWPSAGNTISFENCILADNQAYQAGMAKLNGGTLDIINSTIANNRATDHSGAIYNQLATITIRNSILWGNQAGTVGHIAHFNGGSITITDSIIQNDDDGNFSDAPFFTATGTTVVSGFASEDDPWFVGSGDYHIHAFSPAIDNASATYAPALDIDNQSRPQGAADDIGADEYVP